MEAILVVTYQRVKFLTNRLTRSAYHNSGGIGLLPSHSYTFRTESQNLPQEAEAPAPPERETVSNERGTHPRGRYVYLACVG
jgi:hypothetical protein